jgi:2-iminobutanoate/2-iminopropanoate deaminase
MHLTTKKQITSSRLPVAIAPYSQAILSTATSGNQTLYMSGILPMLLSKELVEEPAGATTVIMNHIAALLKEASMSWNDVVDVIILVRDMNDFKVISESYGDYLKNQNVEILPVRACFQAGKLPLNAVVEIKATAIKNA